MGFSSIMNPQYAALRALGIPAGHHDATRFVYFWAPPYWRFGLIRLRRLGHELPSASSPPLPVEQRHWQGAPPTGPEIVSIGPRPDRTGKPAKLTLGPVDVSGVEQDGTPVLGAPLSTRSPQ
jgi:hypothetical protein